MKKSYFFSSIPSIDSLGVMLSAKGVDKYLLIVRMADFVCRVSLLSLLVILGDSQELSCRLGIDLRNSFVDI